MKVVTSFKRELSNILCCYASVKQFSVYNKIVAKARVSSSSTKL